MQTLPNILEDYAANNHIKLTTEDRLYIYRCFQDNLNPIRNYRDFGFAPGHKALLLNLAGLPGKHDFDFCNPNTDFSTVNTAVGNFYIASTDDESSTALTGMRTHSNIE